VVVNLLARQTVLVSDIKEELDNIMTLRLPRHGGTVTPPVLFPAKMAMSASGGAVGLVQVNEANVQVPFELK